ncbi:MAG: AAA family ATPase [Polyangiales bacterium]
MTSATVEVQVLGPLSVFRDGKAVRLPQSKKTRGLLGYLAITGRTHRRDRLCGLLWDVADDPRGALRWSLSKIRPLVDSDEVRCLVADREHVELQLADGGLDWRVARRELDAGVESITDARLEELADTFRGELLEGLDLSDFDEFTAWCAAEREHARTSHRQVLETLVSRHQDNPATALPHARELVRIDPLNQEARAGLIRMLAAAGRRNEAQAQYESASRLLEELGARRAGPLVAAWHEIKTVPDADATPTREPTPPPAPEPEVPKPNLLVGREEERARLFSVLDTAREAQRLQVFLLKGESGVGKTTLLTELSREAARRGCTVFEASSYEAEAGRPYGPWIDALRRLPRDTIPETRRNALAPLLPELGGEQARDQNRDRLFSAVVETITQLATPGTPALLLFDDIHWCDDASVELLHFVARMGRTHPIAMVLGARDGEIVDNESTMRVLRSFRREGLIEEHLLLPLSEGEVAELVRGLGSDANASEVFAQSGGNALLARELARAIGEAGGPVPTSLKELVGDRLDRLPAETGDVLRWAAVLGPSLDVTRIVELVSLEFDPLMNALSTLERHGLLDSETGDPNTYEFNHALVHQVVYSEISEPRRKLMHLRVAKLLDGRPDLDGALAIEIAHHAGVGGDAGLAARACVIAGNRCLQVFANAEAFAHARRGLRYAEELPSPEKIRLKIELEEIGTTARTPDDIEGAVRRIEALAEEALDAGAAEHARLGFTNVSYLRWHVGETRDAHRLSLRAEFASRGASDSDRMVGMAETARCLVILERDVAQAEALLLEARALTERAGEASPWAVFDGLGLLRFHGGQLEEAHTLFERAWVTSKKSGDRLHEFMSLEHLVAVALAQDDGEAACDYARELAAIGEKLREGSEGPLGRAMSALCQYKKGDLAKRDDVERALDELRQVDAKQRLANALILAAHIELDRREYGSAQTRAQEAARVSEALQHPSSRTLADTILFRIARETDDEIGAKRYAAALGSLDGVAHHVRDAARQVLLDAGVGEEQETREEP